MPENRPTVVTPGHQAGSPVLRVEATADPIHPYAVQVGYHDCVRIPMTPAAMRSLRDALTELLAATTPADPADFVTEWARAHGAVVHEPAQVADVLPLLRPAPGSYAAAA